MWKVAKENDGVLCSLIKTPTIYLEPTPKLKIEMLMEEYTHQEWLAYLVGRVSEKENFFVEDISIPPHKEVSGASAEAEPFHIPDNCIGVIHSHHSMGAFHSGTDREFVDKNFPVSITVAKKGLNLEFDTISYQITPCGKGTTIKCPVKYVLPESLFDKEVFLKGAKANVDKGKRVYTPIVQSYKYKPPFLLPPGRGYSGYTDIVTEGDRTYAVDDKGNVLSGKELEDILKGIYKD